MVEHFFRVCERYLQVGERFLRKGGRTKKQEVWDDPYCLWVSYCNLVMCVADERVLYALALQKVTGVNVLN